MGKSTKNILTTKNTQKKLTIYMKYTNGTPGEYKRKGERKQKITHQPAYTTTNPRLYPNQVKKSTKDLVLSSMYKFVQDQKLQRKEDFILLIEMSSLSKAILFLSLKWSKKSKRGAGRYNSIQCIHYQMIELFSVHLDTVPFS